MYSGKRVLAIITARGGSKGLPGKNIKVLNGKPLICWTIERAQESDFLDHIFVSTDSQDIADICEKECGISIAALRPMELARDGTSSVDVLMYTVDFLKKVGKSFDYLILLEPTSPLRKRDDIDNMIKLACENPEKDGVISLGEIHMEHPLAAKKIDADRRIVPYIGIRSSAYQRQQLDKAFFPYGVGYLIKIDIFLRKRAIYTDNMMPYFIERWQGYEVDDIYDFMCIETIMKSREEL